MKNTSIPLVLIQCTGRKREGTHKAIDLYMTSTWFRKARAYAEFIGGDVLILSAKHGLLRPKDEVEDYDVHLAKMPKAERRVWGYSVQSALTPYIERYNQIVVLAGEKYTEFLKESFESATHLKKSVSFPLKGKGIGEQMSFLGKQVNTCTKKYKSGQQIELF